MSTRFPATGIDDATTLPNPAASNATNSPSHAGQHANANDAIKAIETKVGTGASTPAANTLLIGTGTGTSAWSQLTSAQLAAGLSDETGTGKSVFATSPTLITPAVDTINESTPGNGVTVGGVNMKSGAIAISAIPSAAITPNKLATGASAAIVATSETTTSTTYADLATVTDTVTVTIGVNGLALVDVYAFMNNNTANAKVFVGFAISGATTLAANDNYALELQMYASGAEGRLGNNFLVTGLTTGSTTFKMKYRVETGGSGSGTGTFRDRRISVVPL